MAPRRVAILLVALAAVAGIGRNFVLGVDPKTEQKDARQLISFTKEIRPLFQSKCIRCHDDKTRKADLDLSSPTGILKGGESGSVLVPGKPDESLLFKKVHTGSMPPKEKDRLPPAEVETIRNWIASGARFKDESSEPENPALAKVTQHDVIPIMLRRCTACHGLHVRLGGLDLRTKVSMLRGGKSGPAVVSGKPEESLLVKRIRDGQMPPRNQLIEAGVKVIEPTETEVVVRWIAAGLPESDLLPDVASTKLDPLVSDQDRNYWAFQSPKQVQIPAVKDRSRIRNPVDAFILKKLEEKGLSFSEEASRLTLIRRASFDLTGLPPEPHEVRKFLDDPSPDAYEKLIDRLLASPRYGERWGRYWLDLAGYADSEGKREQDLPRPHAWRYRDYVIQSFNKDKPYDRFLLEQLAGDELADYEHAPEITPELYDNLVATGFLRMVPDGSWANITGSIPDRIEVIADEIDVLGSAVMGLTLKCARCHSHKFDPIPHRDYYRIVDVFKGALDEYNWLRPDIRPGLGPVSLDVLGGRHLPFVTTAERKKWEAAKKEKDKPPEPRIQALWDRGEPSPTYIYRRGDPLTPGALVGPGVPSVLTDGKTPFAVKPPWPDAKKTGRRLAFAQWLIQPEHPLTARVAVNRIWKQHFGTGIVKTLGNFGKAAPPPTHPELLDWLAREFVRSGWSFKAMHRLLMTSTAYRQSSTANPAAERGDSDNAMISRMPLSRLDAESLYDTLLLVGNRLDETPFGPADGVQVRADGFVSPSGSSRGWRRLIYVKHLRKDIPTHLDVFDYPQMNPNCIERRDSIVAPQALHLMNAGLVHQLAESFAERVLKEGTDPAEQIARIYWIAYSRGPNEDEAKLGLNTLKKLQEEWAKQNPQAVAKKSLTTYCHAILNSAEFLYVD